MITVSIIFYNTPIDMVSTIIQCADRSIIDCIFIVDNSPTNKLEEIVRNLSSKIVYIFGQGNVGYGAGNNIAITKAIELGAKYHIVLNPDIYFEKEVIENLAQFMDSHKDIGMTIPNVISPNGRMQFVCKLLPTPLDIIGRRLLPKKHNFRRIERYEMRSTGYKDIRNVPCLSGCFMFLNMATIKQIGLFDERFFMYFEDFDLMRRLHKVSKTVFYPKVTIIHKHAAEHRTNKKLLKISIESAIKYFNKWGWFYDSERTKWNKTAFDRSNIII